MRRLIAIALVIICESCIISKYAFINAKSVKLDSSTILLSNVHGTSKEYDAAEDKKDYIDKYIPYITLVISFIGCALSVYNFYEAHSRRKFENKCLVESRFLTIRTQKKRIVSITFRFCLTNISSEAVALRKIYFSHPALNRGKKVIIDQIGETDFDFAKADEFKAKYKDRKSYCAHNSGEVLPYLLKPNTKYEGHASIGIGDKEIEYVDLLGKKPAENMIVTLLFARPQKFVIPITYKEIPEK